MLHVRLTADRVLLLALIVFSPIVLAVAPLPARAAPLTPAASGPVTVSDLEPFLDEFFAAQLAQTHTPGAVIVVVQDGKILFAKGYGLANVAQALPMDPEHTVMRVGSVSKLFVATAVMQLVEQGRLDLHADVNRYLSAFQVDASYAQPITLAHLLTHTSGLDEAWDTSTDPTAIPSLGDYLAHGKLRRILPPGEAWYYSGVGYALAAYIVESVTHVPFDQYVAANILQPLGMTHSQYLLAPLLPEGLATGYLYQEGAYQPQPVDYWGDYPSSSLTATASDMTRFMIAQLESGCYSGACILRSETVAEMQRQQYAPHPQMEGHTYGFAEGWVNGQRQIGHSGAARGFGNQLTLLPEHRLGYFVSFNQECSGTSACDIIAALRQQFADRYFPASPAPLTPQPTTPLASLSGSYRYNVYQFAHTYRDTVYKLTTLGYDLSVKADATGLLVDDVEYVEIAPLLFQSPATGKRIAFRQNERGETLYLFRPAPYRKLAWHETGAFARTLLNAWGWLWTGVALVWPLTLLIRRRRGGPPATRLEHVAHGLLTLLAALNLAFLASLKRLFWASAAATRLWLTLPLVSIGLTLVALGLAGMLWRRRVSAGAWRAYYALVVLLSGAFVLVLNAWNLIGFKLQ